MVLSLARLPNSIVANSWLDGTRDLARAPKTPFRIGVPKELRDVAARLVHGELMHLFCHSFPSEAGRP